MTELETKLLAALKVANGHLTTELYGLCYEPSPAEPLGVIRAVIAEAEASQQQGLLVSDDGWIPWAASPRMPVKPGTLVDVEFRDGERAYSIPAGLPVDDPNSRLALDWTHYDLDEDIVAYRVVKEVK